MLTPLKAFATILSFMAFKNYFFSACRGKFTKKTLCLRMLRISADGAIAKLKQSKDHSPHRIQRRRI